MKKTINGYLFTDMTDDGVDFYITESNLPKGYEFLCFASEITEEQASEIIPSCKHLSSRVRIGIGRDERTCDYCGETIGKEPTALESFATLLESKDMYLANPMGSEAPKYNVSKDDGRVSKFLDWQSYQSKTYKEILIFKMK